jgi:hypothetical protein
MSDATSTERNTASEPDLDWIVSELSQPYNGILPEVALRAAQRQSAEITPRLIELLRQATAAVRNGQEVDGNGHVFAMYLLAEFHASEGLPAILDAFSLPDDRAYELFGGSITEDGPRILAALVTDNIDCIDTLIACREHYEYVRWEAAETYLMLVRDGRLTRDDAVQRMRVHLRNGLEQDDAEMMTGLVSELASLGPHEAMAEIEEVYRRNLMDEFVIRLDDIRQMITGGEAAIQKELGRLPPTGIEDTVEELKQWYCYQDGAKQPAYRSHAVQLSETETLDEYGSSWDDEPDGHVEGEYGTIRHTVPRIGRNDPCPCGSGKKFKKCCGKA